MSESYKDIVKKTSITGSVHVIQLFFGLIRNKLIALLFGPAGLGVWGLYLSFTEMMQNASMLGLDKSAVKEVAENHDDLRKRNLIIQVSQYSVAILSMLCASGVAVFAASISNSLFGDPAYKVGIWICSVVIVVNSLTGALKSVLNGLGEIRVLAASQLIGVVCGNLLVFSLLPFYDVSAVPFFILVISLGAFVPVLYFYYRLGVSRVTATLSESFSALSLLMKLGMAVWLSAFFLAFITYMINIFLKNVFGLQVVGIYQASWAISNLYIGVILTSMSVVFFPKVCATIDDLELTRNIVDEQIEFGLLVSLPFVLLFFVFSPVFLNLLYSSSFESGAPIIRWLILGVILRLLGFPLGYTLMAKGRSAFYLGAQFSFSAANYALLVLFVAVFGIEGVGANYFAAYCLYTTLMVIFCYKSLGYLMSKSIIKVLGIYALSLVLASLLVSTTDGPTFYGLGFLTIALSFLYSYKRLVNQTNVDVIKYIRSKIIK